jgi:hypothetical protein
MRGSVADDLTPEMMARVWTLGPYDRPATAIGIEIRLHTASNVLHPLVAANKASPRGLCMERVTTAEGGCCWCSLDYQHGGAHWNHHLDVQWIGDDDFELCDQALAALEASCLG